MTKYQPLEDYLAARPESEVPMTFAEIEKVIGAALPASASRREWWSNNERSSVITRAWKRAGFRSANVDMPGRRLVFRRGASRSGAAAAPVAPVVPETAPAYPTRGRHPLRGALKGLIGLARGTDLAAPADAEWGKRSE
ncbi:MAG: hypothetical protein U0802_19385 [Candidatus Binatia bacterium]